MERDHAVGASAQELLLEIFRAALSAVDPFNAVNRALQRSGNELHLSDGGRSDLANYDRVIVVGAGKATARMAAAVESSLGDRISGGAVVVKYGHGAPLSHRRDPGGDAPAR